MGVKLDQKAIEAIELALARGNNAEIRRKGKGVAVAEVKKKTVYCDAPAIGQE